jgi:hypothetical protein
MAYYLYCITKGKISNINLYGVNEEKIKVVNINGLSFLVHECQPEPYQGDDEQVKEWVVQHNRVVEKVWGKQGSVIPMTFDVIIEDEIDNEKNDFDNKNKREGIYQWISDNFQIINKRLDYFQGKAEYGVKIFITNPNNFDKKDLNINNIEQDKKGVAYLKGKRAKKVAKNKIKKKIDNIRHKYLNQIETVVSDVVSNKNKSVNGKIVLINISVLATKKESKRLGVVLDEINNAKEFKVHYSGPWPCYSFIGDISFQKKN